MGACLSDDDLTSLAAGSASDDEVSAWKAHIASCDGCGARLARRQMGLVRVASAGGGTDDGGDPDETLTVKRVGNPSLDVGAEGLPADAIPGYP